MCSKTWYKFMCDNSRLQLKGTLNGGQSFRWKKQPYSEDPTKDQYVGMFDECVWWLVQETDHILYKVFDCNKTNNDIKNASADGDAEEPATKKLKTDDSNTSTSEKYDKMLHNYFRLDINLEEYYEKWAAADTYFKVAAQEFYGIRILKQDPIENIFSFICSSNNNISRISTMVDKMCVLYGNKICEIDGETYYSFPEVEALAQPGVESTLRDAGFGYRAGYINKSACKILGMGGNKWIEDLKTMTYMDARKSLMLLTGIGAKVADCICLMSLGHLEAIPIDTHIYQIAKRCYLKHLPKQKSVNDKIYNEIGDFFRNLYGPLAGWAHTVLFCADLKIFQSSDEKTK